MAGKNDELESSCDRLHLTLSECSRSQPIAWGSSDSRLGIDRQLCDGCIVKLGHGYRSVTGTVDGSTREC
jgi:hypothetical protein